MNTIRERSTQIPSKSEVPNADTIAAIEEGCGFFVCMQKAHPLRDAPEGFQTVSRSTRFLKPRQVQKNAIVSGTQLPTQAMGFARQAPR